MIERVFVDKETARTLDRISAVKTENVWDLCFAGEIVPSEFIAFMKTQRDSIEPSERSEYKQFFRIYASIVYEHVKRAQQVNPALDKKTQFLIYWNSPVQAKEDFLR